MGRDDALDVVPSGDPNPYLMISFRRRRRRRLRPRLVVLPDPIPPRPNSAARCPPRRLPFQSPTTPVTPHMHTLRHLQPPLVAPKLPINLHHVDVSTESNNQTVSSPRIHPHTQLGGCIFSLYFSLSCPSVVSVLLYGYPNKNQERFYFSASRRPVTDCY